VEVQLSECYLPVADQCIDLYATPDGEAEFDLQNGGAGDPTAAMTVVDLDIEVIAYSTDPWGPKTSLRYFALLTAPR